MSSSSRLSDEVPSVRQTAVTVLTQLVLKDVLKVKGQVSEVAVLLIDPEPHITSLALNFFNELATKVRARPLLRSRRQPETLRSFSIPVLCRSSQDNAIYNLLPDIISRLSDPERHMTTDDFNTIMKSVASRLLRENSSVEYILGQPSFVSSSDAWCVFFRQLFSYITKERQTESLVEKLCQRFRTAK